MNTSSEVADLPAKPKSMAPLLLGLSFPLAIILKMGFFFLIIGMMPTLLTIVSLRTPRMYIISTIGAFNFAGIFPDLLSITVMGGQWQTVVDRLSDISIWISAYGAALLGLGIVWLSPAIALQAMDLHYRGRVRQLENIQKKMEEEWGPGITGRRDR